MLSRSVKISALVLATAMFASSAFAASTIPMGPYPTKAVASAIPMGPYPTKAVASAIPMGPYPTGKTS